MSKVFALKAKELGRLRELILGLGADPARWPEADRGLAQGSGWLDAPELQEALAQARRLDGILDGTFGLAVTPEPSALLRARILAALPDGLSSTMVTGGAGVRLPVRFSALANVRRIGAAAACLLMGLAGGATLGSAASADELDEILTYASLEVGQDWLDDEFGESDAAQESGQ